jgi:hypothetical protein
MTIIASQANPAAQWPLYHSPTGPRKNPKHPATALFSLLAIMLEIYQLSFCSPARLVWSLCLSTLALLHEHFF